MAKYFIEFLTNEKNEHTITHYIQKDKFYNVRKWNDDVDELSKIQRYHSEFLKWMQ